MQAAQTEEQWEFAGITGLVNADVQNSSVELGLVPLILNLFKLYSWGHTSRRVTSPQATVLPPFQHTFVFDTAMSLCLLFALDPPPFDLGLRRVYRLNHTSNEAANRSARRMGFEFEGVLTFDKVIPAG